MFEDSLFASAPLPQSRNRAPALISIGVQAALVALLLIVPILHPDLLPTAARQIALLPPPPLMRPVPPPPPPTPVHVTTLAPSEAPMAPATQQPRLQRQPFLTDARPVETPALAFGTPGTPNGAPVAILDVWGPSSPNVVVAHSGTGSGTADHGTLHISTGVMAGRLLAPIQPQYPPIARISHTEGSVVVQAIIAKDGRIESAHVVSGPPLLQSAALEAVRAARYRPYLLNGQPTEVETTITINFKLGS
jgi:protein TonB